MTVGSWAHKGLLRARTAPGGHRRNLRQEVERFAADHRLRPYTATERILAAGTERCLAKPLDDHALLTALGLPDDAAGRHPDRAARACRRALTGTGLKTRLTHVCGGTSTTGTDASAHRRSACGLRRCAMISKEAWHVEGQRSALRPRHHMHALDDRARPHRPGRLHGRSDLLRSLVSPLLELAPSPLV